MIWWLKILADLLEDPTHSFLKLAPGDPMSSSGFHKYVHSDARARTHTLIGKILRMVVHRQLSERIDVIAVFSASSGWGSLCKLSAFLNCIRHFESHPCS